MTSIQSETEALLSRLESEVLRNMPDSIYMEIMTALSCGGTSIAGVAETLDYPQLWVRVVSDDMRRDMRRGWV